MKNENVLYIFAILSIVAMACISVVTLEIARP